ncbi:hypothetical protein [Pseudomonas sp. P8_241]|uniref:hypothetical protein n=1 Tax=Pseudomonas sp. P8_241 TaxID=3043445 RepID=UPI002A35FCD3|nr:hypothetical protein [Pseudomonas sp. P8_241]WPN45110.1 hypothetical protein QMK58_18185 [Pseudomonas sp. P8_241]
MFGIHPHVIGRFARRWRIPIHAGLATAPVLIPPFDMPRSTVNHTTPYLISDKASKVFDRAYDITIRMLVSGQPLEDIAIGIGHDSQKPETQLAEEHGEARLLMTMSQQSIPLDGKVARAELRVCFCHWPGQTRAAFRLASTYPLELPPLIHSIPQVAS